MIFKVLFILSIPFVYFFKLIFNGECECMGGFVWNEEDSGTNDQTLKTDRSERTSTWSVYTHKTKRRDSLTAICFNGFKMVAQGEGESVALKSKDLHQQKYY